MNNQIFAQARQIQQQALPQMFQRPNVVACGLGYKIRGTEQTQELSVIVSVVRKVPKAELAPSDLVPEALDGLPTDVIETGRIRAFMPPVEPKARHRPAMPGISVGHHLITAGTLGLLVQRGSERFILSNNHVLANSNNAKIGDPIWQPGPLDGGNDNEKIATLAEFLPLDFGEQQGQCKIAGALATLLNLVAKLTGSSHRLQSIQHTPGVNRLDAALARPDAPDLISPEILSIGLPIGSAEPQLGIQVQKMGRTTGYTQGIIQQSDVSVNVDYNGRTAYFTDQLLTTPMSAAGDSGSAILDMNRRAVGLLFAGSDQATIFTPLQRVLEHFGVTLVTA